MSSKSSQQSTPSQATTVTLRKMGMKYKILLIIVSLVLMALLRTGFVFVVVGMLPSIVSYYFDQSKHRYGFKTILYCNMAGILPFVGKLLRYGPSSMALQEVMQTPSTWIIIYGAASMGVMLIGITPQIAHMIISGIHGTQVARLERAQKNLEKEWGKEVTKFGSLSDN